MDLFRIMDIFWHWLQSTIFMIVFPAWEELDHIIPENLEAKND